MRASIRIFARDLRRVVTNPVALVVTLGVCVIPSLYAWINILANWDPYQNTGTVPIAVVVEDEGAEVPGMGLVDAGQMVRERLGENHQLGWEFVDEKDRALDGVRSGAYYAAFVIPRDFTSTLAGVMDGQPEQAAVEYYVNEKANAVAPKVTDTGATTLEEQIAEEFVSVAGRTVAERVISVAQAAEGAADAARGDAVQTLSRARAQLDALADGLDEARGGITGARGAVGRAREGVAGAAAAAQGLAQTTDASLATLGQTRAQLRSLATDLSAAAGAGASSLAELSSAASHDIGELAGDAGWAQGRLQAAIGQVRSAAGTVRGLRLSLEHAREAVASIEPGSEAARELQAEVLGGLDAEIGILDQLSQEQAARLDELEDVSQEAAAGAEAAGRLAGSVDDAVQAGAGALEGLRAALAQEVAPGLSDALDALAEAGGRMAAGVAATGPLADQADGTLVQLDALLGQCDATLGAAAADLRDSAARLGSLADDLAAAQGAEALGALGDALELDPSSVGQALGSPVDLEDEPVFPVENYGSGVAPFYVNLALWVGGFVLVAIFKLEVDREGLGPAGATPRQAFFGRWLLLALLGQVQALVCCSGVVALGVQCASPAALLLAGAVASLVYVFVVYVLASAFKHVGKALAVLLVVLQIPGASGLYPIQMQPAFFRALGPWLPFTYGINAMREAVAGFYDGNYVRDLALLLAFALPALLLGVAARGRLLGVNAVFDRKMGETDLLVAERVGERDPGHLAAVLDALATSPAHRRAFLARAASFERAYPALARRGLLALAATPALLALLAALVPGRFVVLVLWVAALVAASGYLIGLEYAHERLRERRDLARRDEAELLSLARGSGEHETATGAAAEREGEKDGGTR